MRRTPATALVLVVAAMIGCGGSDVSRAVGARCDSSDECDDRCLAPTATWPGGMCTLSCDDDGDCPDDARCAAEEGGVCLFECNEPGTLGDCGFLGDGWTCQTVAGRPEGEVNVCRGS